MSRDGEYRHQPAESRRRGLPAIGFAIIPPPGVELDATPTADRAVLLACRERDGDGHLIGELEVAAFSAALIMDRDGILESMVDAAAAHALATPAAGRLDALIAIDYASGASGYRAEVVLLRDGRGVVKPARPYVAVCALGASDIVDAGLLVTARHAQPTWPAAHALLDSLRIVRLGGSWEVRAANDHSSRLPMVGPAARRRF